MPSQAAPGVIRDILSWLLRGTLGFDKCSSCVSSVQDVQHLGVPRQPIYNALQSWRCLCALKPGWASYLPASFWASLWARWSHHAGDALHICNRHCFPSIIHSWGLDSFSKRRLKQIQLWNSQSFLALKSLPQSGQGCQEIRAVCA